MLAVIVIPCIKNPGSSNNTKNTLLPDNLTICYQNIQGLIPFTQLSNNHPDLDQAKISELHAYIYDKCPDIVILNETWLKSTIYDNEILPDKSYKVFWCDRTKYSHPPDPDNPKKFRRNGGGVLIAVSSNLIVSSNHIKLKCKSEYLAIELVLSDGSKIVSKMVSKIVIAICYWVGTLGTPNCHEIASNTKKPLRKKKHKQLFLIGDFNLRGANWENGVSSNYVENVLMEKFMGLGLIQHIKSPTHKKGNSI